MFIICLFRFYFVLLIHSGMSDEIFTCVISHQNFISNQLLQRTFLSAAREENKVLQAKVKELRDRVHELSVENQALLCEVEEYRREKLASGTKSAPASLHDGIGPLPSQQQAPSDDEFVVSGNGTYTDEAAVTLKSLHASSNLLSCALSKDCTVLATGGADSYVSLCQWGGALAPTDDAAAKVVSSAARVRCDAPVICVGFGQADGGSSIVAAGCMDGSVKLVEYGAGVGDSTTSMGARLLKPFGDPPETAAAAASGGIKHAKYVKVVAWSASASLLASASADGTIVLTKVGKPDEDGAVKIEKVQTMHLPGAVEAMCFLDDGDTLCAYARDTAYLSYFDLQKLDSEGAKQTKVTVNESCVKGFEEHVSFAIMCLVPSPNGKYVAAATDTSRNIIFEKGSPRQVRNLYGHKNDGFSVPKIAWSSSGQYILGNTQDDCSICVWDIASGDIVKKLDDKVGGHSGQVREIFSSPTSDTVATASFDKTAKIWLPKMG